MNNIEFNENNDMAKKPITKSLPSDEDIENKKEEFSKIIEDIINGKYEASKKDTVTNKLDLIKDMLIKLKDDSGKPRVSYRTITQIISEHFDLDISDQTVRKFCQSQLGFKKAERKSSEQNKQESLDKKVADDAANKSKNVNENYDAAKHLSCGNINFE